MSVSRITQGSWLTLPGKTRPISCAGPSNTSRRGMPSEPHYEKRCQFSKPDGLTAACVALISRSARESSHPFRRDWRARPAPTPPWQPLFTTF